MPCGDTRTRHKQVILPIGEASRTRKLGAEQLRPAPGYTQANRPAK
jgi:hypothetical protein